MSSYEANCRRLHAFFAELADSDDETLHRAVSADRAVPDAALAILAHAFTPRGGDATEPPPAAAHYTALASIVLLHAPPQRGRFLDEIALSVDDPERYRLLAQRVGVAVPAVELEAALIAALKGDDELRCANALAIQYYLYGHARGPRLSDAGRAAIAEEVAALAARPDLSQRVRSELGAFTLPDNPV